MNFVKRYLIMSAAVIAAVLLGDALHVHRANQAVACRDLQARMDRRTLEMWDRADFNNGDRT